jgi:SAM-dependent methyltransferase
MSQDAEIKNCPWFFRKVLKTDKSERQWNLTRCKVNHWVRLAQTPLPEEAYPTSYYGQGNQKFIPGIEWLSTLPPALLRSCSVDIENRLKLIGRPPSVLDIGCGRGYLLKRLSNRGWQCAGIDIPQSPIPLNIPNFDFNVGSADEHLPWASETFDLVILNHVLEHTFSPQFVLREARRVLRPDGIIYIGVPDFGSWQASWFKEFWFPLEIPRHLHHFEPLPLKFLLENQGFHISRLSMRSIRQGIFGFIQSCLNYLDPKHRDFLFEVMKGRRDISLLRITAHLFTSLILFPFALLESLISPLFRGGPVIILVAQRQR